MAAGLEMIWSVGKKDGSALSAYEQMNGMETVQTDKTFRRHNRVTKRVSTMMSARVIV